MNTSFIGLSQTLKGTPGINWKKIRGMGGIPLDTGGGRASIALPMSWTNGGKVLPISGHKSPECDLTSSTSLCAWGFIPWFEVCSQLGGIGMGYSYTLNASRSQNRV